MNYQQYNKEANATYFKIAAMHCEFSQNEIESGHATWRNIGELQSVDRDGSTSPTSYIGKKVTLLNSSNGDLNTGDLLGLVCKGYGAADGDSNGSLTGCITLMLELR